MKYFVNENCIGCGMCADTCPEVFEMTEENVAIASKDEVAEAAAEQAEEAKNGCPVEAIEEA